jgi:glycosyltransferase involved in cell wall biosynthesis
MKLLLCFQHYIGFKGSSGTRLYEYSKLLAKRGHQVTVVCGKHDLSGFDSRKFSIFGKDIFFDDGVKVILHNIPYSNQMSMIRRTLSFVMYFMVAAWYCLVMKYDRLVTSTVPPTVTPLCFIAKIIRNKKVILEITDLWPDLPVAMGLLRSKFLIYMIKKLELIGYLYSDGVICYAAGVEQIVRDRATQLNLKIKTIPNGVNLEIFTPNGFKDNLSQYGVTPNDFIAIYTGAHGWANGLDYLIETSKFLQSMGDKKVKIILIGEGYEKKQLISKASALKLKNIIFIDPMPKSHLPSIMRRADVALQILKDVPAFYYGTSPNKFFEYLGCGLPIIVNYPGWIADLIDEYCFGVEVSANDPSSLAKTLVELASQNDLISSMSNNAYLLAEKNFSTKLLGDEWCKVIEQF